MWWARTPIATGPATALRLPSAQSGIAALQFPASVRVTAWGRLPPQELIICQFVIARAGRYGMVGRCSEILERLAVEPKMIPPGLKIRSISMTPKPIRPLPVDGARVDVIQAPKLEPRIMRYELSDFEATKDVDGRVKPGHDG
jgi:hypothetical protein